MTEKRKHFNTVNSKLLWFFLDASGLILLFRGVFPCIPAGNCLIARVTFKWFAETTMAAL